MTSSNHTSSEDLTSVDLMDRAHHSEGPPHELFARLRAECPVHPGVSAEGQRFWSVTREQDVAAVSRDPGTFSSARGGVFVHPDQVAPLELLQNILLYKDPPDHQKYRKILASVFTPKAVSSMEATVRARVTEAIDAVIADGHCDFVDDIAGPVPLRVLAGLLGLPLDDIDKLRSWTEQLEKGQLSDQPAAAVDTFGEMVGYLNEQIQRQLEQGDDSLVTRLNSAQVDGESLAHEEILTFFGLLVFAGNDTTRNTTALGTLALLQNEQWSVLREEPGLVPSAVEEVLRWTSVVKYFARTATCDTTLSDQDIAEGDKVVTWFTSASRDSDLVDDPQRFDVRRENPKHRAFGGGGPHLCLGNQLARLELRVLFEELPRRMPDLTLAAAPTFLESNWAHALTAMPVSFSADQPR